MFREIFVYIVVINFVFAYVLGLRILLFSIGIDLNIIECAILVLIAFIVKIYFVKQNEKNPKNLGFFYFFIKVVNSKVFKACSNSFGNFSLEFESKTTNQEKSQFSKI